MEMSFVSMDMLIIHLIGDYMLQSDNMAKNKEVSLKWAFIHAFVYTIPFILLTLSIKALFFIMVTHAFIDRYKLAKYIIFYWNKLWNGPKSWHECDIKTGYSKQKPIWLATWLFIIIDNTMHLILNATAINFL